MAKSSRAILVQTLDDLEGRAQFTYRIAIACILWATCLPLAAQVVINEIHYNPDVKTDRVEFIEVDYQLGFPWPTVGDPPGYSIELVNPSFDNDLGGNWRASVAMYPAHQTQTLVPEGAMWKYLKGFTEASSPTTAWRELEFDDSTWLSGTTPVGYGESFLSTVLNDMRGNYTTVFFRKKFVVADPFAVSGLIDDSRGWPQSADGSGHSLVPVTPTAGGQATGALDYPGNWRR